MANNNSSPITIVLTEEQRQLILRETGMTMTVWEVDLAVPELRMGHVGAPPARPTGRAVYLTNQQREVIRAKTGRECSFIQIENTPIDKYGGPPPFDRWK